MDTDTQVGPDPREQLVETEFDRLAETLEGPRNDLLQIFSIPLISSSLVRTFVHVSGSFKSTHISVWFTPAASRPISGRPIRLTTVRISPDRPPLSDGLQAGRIVDCLLQAKRWRLHLRDDRGRPRRAAG